MAEIVSFVAETKSLEVSGFLPRIKYGVTFFRRNDGLGISYAIALIQGQGYRIAHR